MSAERAIPRPIARSTPIEEGARLRFEQVGPADVHDTMASIREVEQVRRILEHSEALGADALVDAACTTDQTTGTIRFR